MAIALAIFGVVFAGFCVWLTVRIVNRRERWAKRTLAGMMVVSVLYALSSGPMRSVATIQKLSAVEVLDATVPADQSALRISFSEETSGLWLAAYGPLLWASEQPWCGSVIREYWDLFPIPMEDFTL